MNPNDKTNNSLPSVMFSPKQLDVVTFS